MKKIILLFIVLLSAFQISISQNVWTQKADFGGNARWGGVGICIGSKGYIGTGDITQNFSPGNRGTNQNDWWEFNPATNSWTQKANMPGAGRREATAFCVDGKGYVGAGWDGNTIFTDFWRYDTTLNLWNSIANFPGLAGRTPASFSPCMSFCGGDKGYVSTGNPGFAPYSQEIWEYDPGNDTWSQKADFPGMGRSGAVAFEVGERAFLGTGNDNLAANFSSKDFWEYDAQNDVWTQRADFPGPERRVAVAFATNTKGYIGLGWDGVTFFQDFWEFDPLTNQWAQVANFTGAGRFAAVAFGIGTKGYVGTGATLPLKKDFWEYSPVVLPGSSCETAIDLGTDDTIISFTLSDSVLWVKFAPNSDKKIIRLQNLSDTNNSGSRSMSLFNGCPALSAIRSIIESKGNSIILDTTFIAGSIYYLKLSQNRLDTISYKISITPPCQPPQPIVNPSAFIFSGQLILSGSSAPSSCNCYCVDIPYQMDIECRCNNESFSSQNASALEATTFLSLPDKTNNCTIVPYNAFVTPLSIFCPGMTYKCRFRETVYDGGGLAACTSTFIGPWSAPVQFTTPGNAPAINASITSTSQCSSPFTLTASANGGCTGGPYTFQWSPGGGNTSSININAPSIPTYYSAVVTNSCGSTGTATILVNPPPRAHFNFLNELCNGSSFSFNGTGSTGGNTIAWEWNFGDGSAIIVNTLNPIHSYQLPGQYVVTLTGTDIISGCCTKYSALVSVSPSEGLYNQGCCSILASYEQNATTGLFSFDITASGTDPYPFSGTGNSIKDTIFIKPGVTCSLTVVKEFGPWGKIIVEQGATLVLNGATLKGLTCGVQRLMWQGVEVWGDNTKNQTTQASAQGKLKVLNNSEIVRAHNAVVVGKLCSEPLIFACNIPSPKSCFPYDLSFSGGILEIAGGVFTQCANNLRFAPYSFLNTSKVVNCNFSGGLLPDPGYTLGGASYQYDATLNSANRHYAKANSVGRTSRFAHLWGIRSATNIKAFVDNTFANAEIGIEMIDSRAVITKGNAALGNQFQNMMRHINIRNTSPSMLYVSTVSGNTFYNSVPQSSVGFAGPIRVGIYVENGTCDIHENRFQSPTFIHPLPTYICDGSASQNNNQYGIYLRNSSANVVDNLFNKTLNGVVAVNSQTGSIAYAGSALTTQQGNLFLCNNIGITTAQNSSKLSIKCNTTDVRGQGSYFRNLYNVGVLAAQGQQSLTNKAKPAGNRFDLNAVTGTPKRQISSLQKYTYFAHVGPFPYVPVDAGSTIYINNTSIACTPNHVTCCSDPCGSGCIPCCRLAQITNSEAEISALEQEFAGVLANLDKGQKAALLSAISGNTSNGSLKNLLIQNSPLSDEVLMAFINKMDVPPGHFKEIILPNSPVSEDVAPALNSRLSNLPPGISAQIKDAQTGIAVRTLSAISRQISAAVNARQYQIDQLGNYYIQNDSIQKAVDLLEGENSMFADQQLVSAYLTNGDITRALIKLSDMSANNPEEQAFIDLHSILLNLQTQEKTLFEMNNAQEQVIRSIANMNTVSPASSSAQNILYLVFGEQFSTAIDTIPANVQREHEYFVEEKNIESVFEVAPNPIHDFIFITYNLPDKVEFAMVNIYDIIGNKVSAISLDPKNGTEKISLKGFENGIYLCRFEVNGVVMAVKKVLLIQE